MKPLWQRLGINPEKDRIISIVGAGGKTSVLFTLAEEFLEMGKRVVITTTTHMQHPNWLRDQGICIPGEFFEPQELLENRKLPQCVILGTDDRNGKISSPGTEWLCRVKREAEKLCGIVLIEADGARRRPVKGYRDWEPAVDHESDVTVAVLGLSGLHQRIRDVCFHVEGVCTLLGKLPEELLTLKDYEKLLRPTDSGKLLRPTGNGKLPRPTGNGKPEGNMANLQVRSLIDGLPGRCAVVLNQADSPERRRAGELLSERLKNDWGLMACTECLCIYPKFLHQYAVILLAAGNSVRYGGNKLIADWKGKPMYRWILEAAARLPVKKVMVTQYEEIGACAEKLGYEVRKNPCPEMGISGSIRLGLETAGEMDGYLFVVCDQPDLTEETLLGMLRRAEENPGKIIAAVTKDGNWANPNLFPAGLREELEGIRGDRGGKTVMRNHLKEVVGYHISEEEARDIDVPKKPVVVVRGGGDLATGTIYALHKAGYPVLVLETKYPAAIRRLAAVSEAIYEGKTQVEDMTAIRIAGVEEAPNLWESGKVPVLVDPEGEAIRQIKPRVVVDAILAKKNLGTSRNMAPLTIGLGPGFTAGQDVDVVIETMRGHDLGRVFTEGSALPNTGVPGNIGGYTKERVIHAPQAGILHAVRGIGDLVEKGEEIAWLEAAGEDLGQKREERISIPASISGVLRGILREGYPVTKGFKIADIDPRAEQKKNCTTISDKARCIGGSVLMVVCGRCSF